MNGGQFDVATNLDGQTVAAELAGYWRWLLDEHRTVPTFAIATAYFNPGGFAQLAEVLEASDGVRLLLGAEPDVAADLHRRRRLTQQHPTQAAAAALRRRLSAHHAELAEDRDLLAFSRADDALVGRMVAWLRSGGVQVRRLESRFLHGKAYLAETGPGVMVGSSNFTRAGLTHNVELNLARFEADPVGEVRDWFDRLWDESVDYDLAGLYEERFAEHDPYVVFLRMLWERYGDELTDPDEPAGDLGLTEFQRDGVARARRLLHRHNGVVIADGVGLGKTFVAGELLREATEERRQRALVVAPAALRDGPWTQFRRFAKLRGVDVISYDQLVGDPKLGGDGRAALSYDPDDYALVVVDEAHAYRNPTTDRVQTMRRLLSGRTPKQLVLLTATPVNNSLWDLYHLLNLFIRNDAAFADLGVASLRGHFRDAEAMDADTLSPQVLFDVLDAVAVRRTRRFVKKFYPDATVTLGGVEQPVTFPQPQLRRVDYQFDTVLPGFFERFAYALGVDPDDENPLPPPSEFTYGSQLSLARYAPSDYLVDGEVEVVELQNAGLLRSGLLKRFESSPYAFAKTCRTMAASHDRFLAALADGWVLTGDALAIYGKTDSDEVDFDALPADHAAPASAYRVDALQAAVEGDRDLLRAFADEADTIVHIDDPKLAALVDELVAIAGDAYQQGGPAQMERDRRKTLVFTYFTDTVNWIADHLQWVQANDPRFEVYADRWSTVDGTGEKQHALFGFAPVATQAPEGTVDRYDILVTTDVLAEGVNLQQARNIINYDLPWNPMRMVQRHGRIDRIGSPHDRVFLRSMFPTDLLNELLRLETTLQRKLAKASRTIGVEGGVVPGMDGHDPDGEEPIFGQVGRLADGDVAVLEELEDAATLSGEEFRRELADRLDDAAWQQQIVGLPWVAGSGKRTSGQGGFVFCVRVGDHRQPLFRWVPVSAGAPDTAQVVADTLACLRRAQAGVDTLRVLPDRWRDWAYDAWEVARDDIFARWLVATDPASQAPQLPKAVRDAATLLRETAVPELEPARRDELLDIIEAPWEPRTVRAFRQALTTSGSDVERARQVIATIGELSLTRQPNPEPLPEIGPDDVHLVCWMALVDDEPPTP